jgi:hypothetical protein
VKAIARRAAAGSSITSLRSAPVSPSLMRSCAASLLVLVPSRHVVGSVQASGIPWQSSTLGGDDTLEIVPNKMRAQAYDGSRDVGRVHEPTVEVLLKPTPLIVCRVKLAALVPVAAGVVTEMFPGTARLGPTAMSCVPDMNDRSTRPTRRMSRSLASL